MEIEGFLFDLDGTLVSTEKANLLAYNHALSKFGMKITEDTFHNYTGMDSRRFLLDSFPELTEPEVKSIRDIKASVYQKYFSETFVNENLVNLMRNSVHVKRKGIVTNGKRRNTFEILEYHGLAKLFNVVVTGDDIDLAKPSPEPYLKAVELLGIEPSKILVFEDSQTGCNSAIAAGLRVIRLSNWSAHEK
jgi:HAD superfamily hydrolase (TIGR01509 family)